jgi:wingless-type MMTV integration site family protein 7
MYAVISAGVTYALMDACSRGNISICGCDAHYPSALDDGPAASAWKWGGCSVDLGFGMGFARKFLDAQESDAGDSRSLMNLHNNKAGRKVYNIIYNINNIIVITIISYNDNIDFLLQLNVGSLALWLAASIPRQ